MNEWTVVTVIGALLGLGVTVIKPILSLNTSIIKLTEQMGRAIKDLDELTRENTANHKRIHERIDTHGKMLDEHEERIVHLEAVEKLRV